MARLEVYPFIPEVLGRLGAGADGGSVALGLISNTGSESAERMAAVLAEAGLSDLVTPHLQCIWSNASSSSAEESMAVVFAAPIGFPSPPE